MDTADLYLSVITIQEIEIGVLLAERRDHMQGAVFGAWMNDHVQPAFAGRILAVDTAVALRSARSTCPILGQCVMGSSPQQHLSTA